MSAPLPETDSGLARRFGILLALIVCGWGVLLFRTWSIAVLHRSDYITQGENSARQRYELPAPRGRILDRNGIPLAWDERRFDLVRTGSAPLSEDLLLELEEVLDQRPPATSPDRCVVRGLKPGQILLLNRLIRGGAPLRIDPQVQRMTIWAPRLQAVIGHLETRQGERFGVSGLELQFDHVLRGTPGTFSVIIDRERNWVPSSWKLERAAVPGENVKLPRSLAELEGEEP